jgi:outer membrane protein TolC
MRVRAVSFFSVFGLALLGYNVNGQTTLTDLVKYSLEHSRDIKKSELQCKQSEYTYKEARGHGLPQIEGSASYSKMMLPEIDIPQSAYSMIPAEYSAYVNPLLDQISNMDALYMASAGIQITQLIYSQSYWVGLKTAKKTKELYSILKTKNEEDVISEVALGYYQTGSLVLQLQTVDKSLNNLKEIHRIAEQSYKNDMIKESSVNRLKVTISNLEVTRQTIENGISIQLNYLKALAGMPADSLLTIDTAAMVNNYTNLEYGANFAIENVASYQVLKKQEEVYEQKVKISQAKYYPTLAAYGKLSYSSYSLESEIKKMSNMNTIGLSLTVPIFTSGVTKAKVSQEKMEKLQLQEDIEKTKDLLTINYNNAYLEYKTASEMLSTQKENKELAQKVYNQTSMQYQEGMASMADLLNVNSDYLQADNSYNQQILKCKTSEIKMLKASGNLKSLIK